MIVFTLLDIDDVLLGAYVTNAPEDSDYYKDQVSKIYVQFLKMIKMENILHFNKYVTQEPLEELSYEHLLRIFEKVNNVFDNTYRIDSCQVSEIRD